MNVDFPFRIGADGRTAASPTVAKHIRDMIELVLFTNPGERVMRPDFGTGLQQLVFEPNSPELAATLQLTVQAALNKWLGDIVALRDVVVQAIDSELRVTVTYALTVVGEMREETFVRSVP